MAEAAQNSGLFEEDEARAHCYALISRLFYAPVDEDFVRRFPTAGSEEAAGDESASDGPATPEDGPSAVSFAHALLALQRAMRSVDLQQLRQEHDDIFIGAGKALVTPYTAAYALPSAP